MFNKFLFVSISLFLFGCNNFNNLEKDYNVAISNLTVCSDKNQRQQGIEKLEAIGDILQQKKQQGQVLTIQENVMFNKITHYFWTSDGSLVPINDDAIIYKCSKKLGLVE